MEEILIVDGYNVIGAYQGLKQVDSPELEEARDWLIERLAEYQGYMGTKVYIVFDAQHVPGLGKKLKQFKVEIIFTKENETADERIEKLVGTLKRVQRRIYVATSDHTEQWVIFGQGALRKSARELIIEIDDTENQIKKTMKEKFQKKAKSVSYLNPQLAEIFEKWRRGQ